MRPLSYKTCSLLSSLVFLLSSSFTSLAELDSALASASLQSSSSLKHAQNTLSRCFKHGAPLVYPSPYFAQFHVQHFFVTLHIAPLESSSSWPSGLDHVLRHDCLVVLTFAPWSPMQGLQPPHFISSSITLAKITSFGNFYYFACLEVISQLLVKSCPNMKPPHHLTARQLCQGRVMMAMFSLSWRGQGPSWRISWQSSFLRAFKKIRI